MEIILNIIGLIFAIIATIVMGRVSIRWRGMFRRELVFFSIGFILFSLGFILNIFAGSSISVAFTVPKIGGQILFPIGMAFLVLASTKIFTFVYE